MSTFCNEEPLLFKEGSGVVRTCLGFEDEFNESYYSYLLERSSLLSVLLSILTTPSPSLKRRGIKKSYPYFTGYDSARSWFLFRVH